MSKKLIAFATAVFTMIVMCGAPTAAFAAGGDAVKKEETVYVVTDSEGQQNDVIVSDRLVNRYKVKILKDKTDLKHVENVKGKEKFKRKGNNISWNTGGNDIYYQGHTAKEVPVTMDVKYILDGREISGSELQGKSGDVCIKIRYENNAEYDGKAVPMVVLSGLIITDDSFTDVTIDNGKIISSGEKTIVAGIAAPGLAESLNISESDMGFGSSVKIRGKAKEFNVKDIMTIVTNDLFDNVDTDKLDELDYDDQIKELDNGASKLAEGSETLSDGLKQLNNKVPQLKSATKQLKNGSSKIAGAINQLSGAIDSLITGTEGISSYSKGIQAGLNGDGTEANPGLAKGAGQVAAGVKSVNDAKTVIQANMTELETTKSIITELHQSEEIGDEEYSKMMEAIMTAQGIEKKVSDSSEALYSGSKAVADGLVQMQSAVNGTSAENPGLVNTVNAVLDGEKQIKSSIGAGSSGADTLYGGAAQLAAGMSEMNSQAGTLANGVSQLNSGGNQLAVGMQKLYRDGIKKIADLYNDGIKGLTENLSDMVDAGKNYKSFTILPSNMDGSVKFIYKTVIAE